MNAAIAAAVAGDTIAVEPGTYTGIVFNNVNPGSPGVTILPSDPTDPPIFGVMTWTTSSWIKHSGIEFDFSLVTGDAFFGCRWSACSHLSFEACNIHAALDGDPTNKSQYGFLCYSGSGCHDIAFVGGKVWELQGLIAAQDVTDLTVTGAEFTEMGGRGIDVDGGANITLTNNTYTNAFPGAGTHAEFIAGFSEGGSTIPTGVTITGNTVTRGIGYPVQGVFLTDDSTVRPWTDVTISNNTFQGGLYNAILVGGGKNVTVSGNFCPWYADEYVGAPGGPYETQVVFANIDQLTVTGNACDLVVVEDTCTNVTQSGNTVLSGSGTAPTPASLPLSD